MSNLFPSQMSGGGVHHVLAYKHTFPDNAWYNGRHTVVITLGCSLNNLRYGLHLKIFILLFSRNGKCGHVDRLPVNLAFRVQLVEISTKFAYVTLDETATNVCNVGPK